MKNFFKLIKDVNRTPKGKALLFFGFYFIFFVVIILFIRFSSRIPVMQSEDYENGQVSYSFKIDNILKNNYVYSYVISLDGADYQYDGQRYKDMEMFQFNNKEYFRKEDEYFVLATEKNESVYQDVDYSEIYASHIKNYNNFGITIHNFYYVDLNDALNKNYIGDKVNITDDLEKLKVNDDVLFKIKNKKIEASYVGNKKIIEALTNLVPKSKES